MSTTVSRRLLLINPNTSLAISASLLPAVQRCVPPDVTVDVVTARIGAPYISDERSYAVAGHAALAAWADDQRLAARRPDGVVIACFGDPGLFALREAADCPVTGLAEAAVAEAALHGDCAIVTGGQAWRPMLERLLPALPRGDRVRSIETVELTGAELHADPQAAEALLLEHCRRLLRQSPVDCIIIGGAGLAGIAARLQAFLPVPLIDSVAAAARQVWRAPASAGQGLPAWLHPVSSGH
jgi:allantoin racemase